MDTFATLMVSQLPGAQRHFWLFLALAASLFLAAAYIAGPRLLESFLVVNNPIEKPDALVLMAGSPNHRLPAIVDLYRQGAAPQILLTNDGVRGAWSVKHQRNLYLVEWAREFLLKNDVPESAVVLLDFTKSGSYYDALNTRSYVVAEDTIKSLLVVTTDYHTRRTLWIFQRIFSDTDVRIGVYPIHKGLNHQGRRFYIMAMEALKLCYYQLRYG